MTTHTNPSFSRYLRTFGQLGPVVPEIDLKDALEARRAWKEARKKKYARHIHIFFLNVCLRNNEKCNPHKNTSFRRIQTELRKFLRQFSNEPSKKLMKLKNVAKEIVGMTILR
jgi:hypothetical protein